MDFEDICFWPFVLLTIFVIVQVIRFVFADADFGLLWAARFGKKAGSLAGNVVWITGASSGIGEHLAYELVRAGCKLVLSARRQDELERVKKQCLLSAQVKEEDILVLPLDIKKFESHKDAMKKVLDKFSKVDILVNNAGRSQRALLMDTLLEVDQEILKLNVLGTLSLTKVVLPHMFDRKSGHVVVTSSVAGKLGVPLSAAYSATKFALHGWFDAARIELASYNIHITLVCPGPVFSQIQVESFTGALDKKYGIDMKPNELRMSTVRCAELMAVAMANKRDEVWITLQPILLFTYLAQYAPDIFRKVAYFICRNSVGSVMKKLREGGISSAEKEN